MKPGDLSPPDALVFLGREKSVFTSWHKNSLALLATLWLVFPSRASNVIGHEFSVSESGAATVNIPIQIPRGIGGMEPQLSLAYSSQSGNGLLGVGWTLNGVSAVTRCGKTKLLDGVRGSVNFMPENDRFCIDGSRLVLVEGNAYGANGSVYSTERDNFSRITAVGQFGSRLNEPARFRVETKSGLTYEYGISANSQVRTNMTPAALSANRINTINRWQLQRISDLHGSFVEFFYCGGEVIGEEAACDNAENGGGASPWSGSKVLHYIRYTNRGNEVNGQFGVLFQYEARPDRVQGFHEGSAARQTQRMKAIRTYRDFASPANPGALIRRYVMTYEALTNNDGAGPYSRRATNMSRIRQIQELDAAGNGMPPINFTLMGDAVWNQYSAHSAEQAIAGDGRPTERLHSATGSSSPASGDCGGLTGVLCK